MSASIQETYTSMCNLIEGKNYLLVLDAPSVFASLSLGAMIYLVSPDLNEDIPSRKYLRG